ncbi:hypothetical protein [Nonomuraea basaltis]|nr:hypothetical protein [Nonomuraea basaltis]
MKVRVAAAVAAFALASATASPAILDQFGSGEPPLVDVQTWIQHVNILTS